MQLIGTWWRPCPSKQGQIEIQGSSPFQQQGHSDWPWQRTKLGARCIASDIVSWLLMLDKGTLGPQQINDHTDKKENKIFFICKEIQNGADAKSII
jgi:hypothetical protein